MKFNLLTTGINTLDWYGNYKNRRRQHPNESGVASFARSGVTWAIQEALWSGPTAPLMWAYTAATVLPTVAEMGYQAIKQGPTSRGYNPNFGGRYQDTQIAATMRQRGLQAIQQSRLNARSVLGSEARSLHYNR